MRSLIMRSLLALPVALGMVCSVAAQDLKRGLQNYLDILNEKKKVDELSTQELREVIFIYKRLLEEKSTKGRASQASYESQEIQVAHKDKVFIINDQKYEALTSCFDFEKGDKVIFLAGRPLGVCVSTELLNIRNDRVCKIWCKLDTGS